MPDSNFTPKREIIWLSKHSLTHSKLDGLISEERSRFGEPIQRVEVVFMELSIHHRVQQLPTTKWGFNIWNLVVAKVVGWVGEENKPDSVLVFQKYETNSLLSKWKTEHIFS